jgi:hypothetical protein
MPVMKLSRYKIKLKFQNLLMFGVFISLMNPPLTLLDHQMLHMQNKLTNVIVMPAPVAELSEARAVFCRSNTGIVCSNSDPGMDVCPCFSVLCCPVCRWRPCVGLITRPRSPANCPIDS